MVSSQLELFGWGELVVPKDKNDYGNVYEFLCSLPCFYFGHNKPDLLEIERDFIYKKNLYKLKLRKTRISKDNDSFLGSIDQDVLDTLLYIGTREDTQREVHNGRVRIRVSINHIHNLMKGKVRYEDIKSSIQRLKETQLSIYPINSNGYNNIEWNCETIISQYIIKDERYSKQNDILTYIEFNSSFSEELLKGKIKLINFPKYIALKNPVGKFIYKKLVLSDIFSTKDYSITYHNKSLYTLLLNCGYQSSSTQDRNNTLRTFRQGIKELQQKGIINKCEMTPIKDGNKVEDYFIEITPSKWLVEQNHLQRKKKKFRSYDRKLVEPPQDGSEYNEYM